MATESRDIQNLVRASVTHIAAHRDLIWAEIILASSPDPAQINNLNSGEEYILT